MQRTVIDAGLHATHRVSWEKAEGGKGAQQSNTDTNVLAVVRCNSFVACSVGSPLCHELRQPVMLRSCVSGKALNLGVLAGMARLRRTLDPSFPRHQNASIPIVEISGYI